MTQVIRSLNDLPVIQPTASQHWKKVKAPTPATQLDSFFPYPPLDS